MFKHACSFIDIDFHTNNLLQGLATLPKFICHPCLQQLKFTYNFNLKLQHLINADQKANEENCGIIQQQLDEENRDRTRPFMCELCGRQFKVKEHFETHCKRHSEKTKQFRCVACGMWHVFFVEATFDRSQMSKMVYGQWCSQIAWQLQPISVGHTHWPNYWPHTHISTSHQYNDIFFMFSYLSILILLRIRCKQ